MKKLFVLAAIVSGSLIASKSDAQVYVRGHFGRVCVGVGVPDCHDPYYRGPVGYGAVPRYEYYPGAEYYPGYQYYDYPVWNGHFRDRIYYEHYRPLFFREHPYYRSFRRGRRW